MPHIVLVYGGLNSAYLAASPNSEDALAKDSKCSKTAVLSVEYKPPSHKALEIESSFH